MNKKYLAIQNLKKAIIEIEKDDRIDEQKRGELRDYVEDTIEIYTNYLVPYYHQ